jgi:hypothetical protein
MQPKLLSSTMSRRTFLKAAAATTAAIGASALPFGAQAQGKAKYRRLNVLNPEAKHTIESYKRAIARMLKLPPEDPRNWYRIALTHTMDCPHGNWWFLVWHRGYIGWFEQICRELSGDPGFAPPYWDWTENTDPNSPFHARARRHVRGCAHPHSLGLYCDLTRLSESLSRGNRQGGLLEAHLWAQR